MIQGKFGRHQEEKERIRSVGNIMQSSSYYYVGGLHDVSPLLVIACER